MFSALLFISPAFSATLPSGYTELKYIESSGTQYIDTGVYADKNTEIEMVAKTNGAGTSFIFGVDSLVGDGTAYMFAQTYLDNTLIFDFISNDTSRIKSSVVGSASFHKLETKSQTFYVDDINIGSFSSLSNFIPTHTSYLFYANGLPSFDNNNGSAIQYCKIWQSGTLVREFISVRRNSDGVLGMYDTVTNTFFTNTGTGTFTAGPAVAQPTTVNINWGDLSEPDASGTCTYGETFTAPSVEPTPPNGYKFLGWKPM